MRNRQILTDFLKELLFLLRRQFAHIEFLFPGNSRFLRHVLLDIDKFHFFITQKIASADCVRERVVACTRGRLGSLDHKRLRHRQKFKRPLRYGIRLIFRQPFCDIVAGIRHKRLMPALIVLRQIVHASAERNRTKRRKQHKNAFSQFHFRIPRYSKLFTVNRHCQFLYIKPVKNVKLDLVFA